MNPGKGKLNYTRWVFFQREWNEYCHESAISASVDHWSWFYQAAVLSSGQKEGGTVFCFAASWSTLTVLSWVSSEEWLVMITWYTLFCTQVLSDILELLITFIAAREDVDIGSLVMKLEKSLSALSLVLAALMRPVLQFSPGENEIPDDEIITLNKY